MCPLEINIVSELWLCPPNARRFPALLHCDVFVTHFPQRHAIRRAQRGQSQPVAEQSNAEGPQQGQSHPETEQSAAEGSQRGQSQPGTDQSAAEGSQSSLLDQGTVNIMANVPPESKLHYGVM